MKVFLEISIKKIEKSFAGFIKSCTFALAKAKHWCVSSVG
jgi:hypothetical protein